LANVISQSLILTTARILSAFQLAICSAFTNVAFFGYSGANGDCLTVVFTVTRHGDVSTLKLSILLACASVAFILVDSLAKIEHSAHVLAAAGVVGTINLA